MSEDTKIMDLGRSLTNQLLIAMPGMKDPNFNSTVTLICEHNDDGALGIIINRPLNLKLSSLLDQLSVKDVDPIVANNPIVSGGPIGAERGFVLHNKTQSFKNTISVSDDIQLTLSRDVIEAMATGVGPQKSLIAIGYAGWDSGQLEEEILTNFWLNVTATPELVFNTPFVDRWNSAAHLLGVDLASVSLEAGHA
ncbi:MAG: YqgE/AlgH family protein [Woeseiaceae bacterium]|jgi:putative transcriptional regulator|nr:YqgE/AlgH family protein [Woeseiaceae bacterium]